MTRIFAKQRRPFAAAAAQLTVILSFVAAIAHGVGAAPPLSLGPLTLDVLLKGLPVFLLGVFALMKAQRVDVALLAIGLFGHTAGDVLITGGLSIAQGTDALTFAVYGFGLGHLAYILAFAGNMAPLATLTTIRLQVAALAWGAAGFALYWFWPLIGEQPLHLLIYAGLILLMVTGALLSRYPIMMVGLGGLLFLISDALLATDLILKMDHPYGLLVWPTYYGGQLLLALGIILTPKTIPRRGGYRFS